MQFSAFIIIVLAIVGNVLGQSSSLFNLPKLSEIPSFKNHFNPSIQSSLANIDGCMPVPLPNPLNLDISVCGNAATFLSNGCIRINRLPYGYSLSICAANTNGRPQQQQQSNKPLPSNCIPFTIPMGYKAILCSP
ncbi:hypothetical protein DERP_007920 [Dermatophagoides pteronyssinus]|uniref:Uncharacterized protein n=1 Tax=Dermatophagoides pteronyssinus TaxID=6956 RepID=A0ABQ8ISZ6_DERPT|nr:hypothetical protein DERP_007920 [Dermatophagoides pteronyssinus]